jgi:hypothetical protein
MIVFVLVQIVQFPLTPNPNAKNELRSEQGTEKGCEANRGLLRTIIPRTRFPNPYEVQEYTKRHPRKQA